MSRGQGDLEYKPRKVPKDTRRIPCKTRQKESIDIFSEYESDSAVSSYVSRERVSGAGQLVKDSRQYSTTAMAKQDSKAAFIQMLEMMMKMREDDRKERKEREEREEKRELRHTQLLQQLQENQNAIPQHVHVSWTMLPSMKESDYL